MTTEQAIYKPGSSPTGARHWMLILASLSFASIAIAQPLSLLFSLLPFLGEATGASPTATGWLLTGFLVTSAAALPLAAQMGELYGNRRVLSGMMIIAIVGACITASSHTIGPMIVGMCLAGIGFGAYPVSYALIGEHLDERRRGVAVGVIGGSLLVVVTLAGLLAGPIIDHLSYHWVFWMCAIALIVGFGFIQITVPESTSRSAGRIDWAGALLGGGAAGALLVAFAEAPTWGWGSPGTLTLVVVGVLGLALWVPLERRVEIRGHMPAVSVKVLVRPAVAIAAAIAVTAQVVLYSFNLVLVYFVEVPASMGYGFGYGVTQTTHLLFVNGAVGAAASYAAGYLDRWIDPKWLCLIAGVLLGPASLPLALLHQSPWQIYAFSMVNGLGMGMVIAAVINVVLRAVREEDAGPATAITLIAQSIGGALGVSITTEILTAGTDPTTQVPSEAAFTLAWYAATGAGALVVLCSVLLLWSARRDRGLV
ncbi:MFS transporter [Mycolicibacterium sp. P9-64]|uniref:MFS transporter n=1 Tax=Mycolicibacterium sp. P9-64 TaxID=2024612 RepID=UPI001563D8C3|nr:MFS transporter [Mycolicibacterium sp. P9-64]